MFDSQSQLAVDSSGRREPICCTPKRLPEHQRIQAAADAIAINPANRPRIDRLAALGITEPQHIAVLTTKYWQGGHVALTVGFMQSISAALQAKILSHMNAWNHSANVAFTMAPSVRQAQVRISFAAGGYWSYLGTDILSIPANQQTMNLEGFDRAQPESEYFRVIRHETGHTLGCPHEHARPEIVALLDPAKTQAYFQRTQGWSAAEINAQILTPLNEASLMGTPHADLVSIMTYQFPGACTKSGQAIPGGNDIDQSDYDFLAKIYPLAVVPPVVNPPVNPPVVNPLGVVGIPAGATKITFSKD